MTNSAPQHMDKDATMTGIEYDTYTMNNNPTAAGNTEVPYTEGSAASKEVASNMDLDSLNSDFLNTQESLELTNVVRNHEKNLTSLEVISSGMTPISPTQDPALRAQ
ncbi:hypothetical protein G6F56_002029 [Rhizopus delemar]|uniref:Uncharacterized protein n=1 Tax=Rhizopus stolonifer TaxID=4846 RepID=A0A367KHX7_RHIST|nr:hypothetical protein G6F56_002029 [Rhizopus delemar]RCI01835.1 hypothetical protein CU098_012240 [Rhizopus stolonifer]